MESHSGLPLVTFDMLQCRLIALVNFRIRNGEFTERGLSRMLKVSQPQMHNVLKGRRRLQWELADALLRKLNVSILDLVHEQQAGERRALEMDGFASKVRAMSDLSIEAVLLGERKPAVSEATLWPRRRTQRYSI